MPNYVKYEQIVYEVLDHFRGYNKDYCKVYDGKIHKRIHYEYLLPSDWKEFNKYKNLLKNKIKE